MMNRDLEFLYEIASLRHVQRGWRQHMATDCANVLDHTLRVVWLALLIARREGVPVDENKLVRIAMIHDMAEARTADMSYVQKKYTTTHDQAAMADMLKDTAFIDFHALYDDYEQRASLEAKIVKDADNLDVDMEMKELEEKGHQIPGKWAEYRREIIRDQKLYTETARKMWDEIQASDPSSWHLGANKYEQWKKDV